MFQVSGTQEANWKRWTCQNGKSMENWKGLAPRSIIFSPNYDSQELWEGVSWSFFWLDSIPTACLVVTGPTHCLIFRFVYARIDRPAGTIKFGALGRTVPIQMVKWSNHPWLQKAKRQNVLYIYILYNIRVYMYIDL